MKILSIIIISLLLVASALCCCSCSPHLFVSAQVKAPVMGIFTNDAGWYGINPPANAANATSWVEGYYVQWLEMSGIRVVPFPWNASATEQRYLAERINGILFPGGGLGGALIDAYIEKVALVLGWAMEWNAKGEKFVLWGTCQGFQVLSAAAARNPSVITGPYHGMYPSMMPLNWTANTKTSRMFSQAPPEVYNWLSSKPVTLNWHHYIVAPEAFIKNPSLGKIFLPTAQDNVPNSEVTFIAAMEGANNFNLFATQFHPERPPYEFSNSIISHTHETIAVSQYLSSFIASKLKENNHTFENLNDLESRIVENWVFQYTGWGTVLYWGNF